MNPPSAKICDRTARITELIATISAPPDEFHAPLSPNIFVGAQRYLLIFPPQSGRLLKSHFLDIEMSIFAHKKQLKFENTRGF
ncbi:MAG: hypothetical protein ACI9PU_000859 [Ascidiaceihabitans sp.]|jgi:hypothetical protein|tara:strand:+ start:40 stop:288 length:249 start_codon:yes stop_codon:yes gene_type:complete